MKAVYLGFTVFDKPLLQSHHTYFAQIINIVALVSFELARWNGMPFQCSYFVRFLSR